MNLRGEPAGAPIPVKQGAFTVNLIRVRPGELCHHKGGHRAWTHIR